MAKSEKQNLKVIYLAKILLEETNENHGLTMAEIISELNSYGIKAERKSIYSDVESLKMLGFKVVGCQENRTYTYSIKERLFGLPELKLLVDSVQSAKFISEKKSNELIKKLEELASKLDTAALNRHVIVAGRVKTMNESIFINVDAIQAAMAEDVMITFKYFQWNADKKMEFRRDGERYEVSPWALLRDNENYYLIAYDSHEKMIKHFRVDKMLKINSSINKREGEEEFKSFDAASYTKKMFGMFGGREVMVKLRCENSLAGVMIDRFGKDAAMVKTDKEHFEITAEVSASPQFIAWVIGLGEGVKIISPDYVVDMMKNEIQRLVKQYE